MLGQPSDRIRMPVLHKAVACNFIAPKMKSRSLVTYSIIYLLTITGFTFYWRQYFTKHVNFKGDEFTVFAAIILIFTYIFCLITMLKTRIINLLVIAIFPIVISILSFLIGMSFLLLFDFDIIPDLYIPTYGLLYGILALFSIFIFRKKTKIFELKSE